MPDMCLNSGPRIVCVVWHLLLLKCNFPDLVLIMPGSPKCVGHSMAKRCLNSQTYFSTSVLLFHLLSGSHMGARPVQNCCVDPHFIYPSINLCPAGLRG